MNKRKRTSCLHLPNNEWLITWDDGSRELRVSGKAVVVNSLKIWATGTHIGMIESGQTEESNSQDHQFIDGICQIIK